MCGCDLFDWLFSKLNHALCEKNTRGAIPVALLLQQLMVNLHGLGGNVLLTPSYDLDPLDGVDPSKCEVDFVAVYDRTYPERAAISSANVRMKATGAIESLTI